MNNIYDENNPKKQVNDHHKSHIDIFLSTIHPFSQKKKEKKLPSTSSTELKNDVAEGLVVNAKLTFLPPGCDRRC